MTSLVRQLNYANIGAFVMRQLKAENGEYAQSPSMFSATSRLVNSLSMNPPLEPRSNRLLASSAFFASSAADRSKRVSRPETVGMKNGAASGAFGGSFGLLRC